MSLGRDAITEQLIASESHRCVNANTRKYLNEIAEKVIDRLRGKVIIHRYDAFSTNSVYLKFDYGIANSLRISDHEGKMHLRYRYNVLTTQGVKKTKTDHGFERIFYSPQMVKALCRDILEAKKRKQRLYLDYDGLVQKKALEVFHEAGFWSGAREVSA